VTGIKYTLAHKRADKAAWSSSDAAQRRRLIQILEETIGTLKQEPSKGAPGPPPKRDPEASP